ncbi:MAG: hypothetical protein Q9220_006233 [cf. Caloplaca sp. 1 TL-2023]
MPTYEYDLGKGCVIRKRVDKKSSNDSPKHPEYDLVVRKRGDKKGSDLSFRRRDGPQPKALRQYDYNEYGPGPSSERSDGMGPIADADLGLPQGRGHPYQHSRHGGSDMSMQSEMALRQDPRGRHSRDRSSNVLSPTQPSVLAPRACPPSHRSRAPSSNILSPSEPSQLDRRDYPPSHHSRHRSSNVLSPQEQSELAYQQGRPPFDPRFGAPYGGSYGALSADTTLQKNNVEGV